MTKWHEVKLGDVCIKITDGSHWSPKTCEVGFPMASVKDMEEYKINLSSCRKISKEDYQELVKNDCKPLKNDVLIAKDGSYLKQAFEVKTEEDVVILSSIAIIRPNLNLILPTFLKYIFKNQEFIEIVKKNYVSGAVIPRIILKDFKNIPISLPPLEIQKKIAGVLSALDDKIELNNKINNNLEQQAQALFNEKIVNNSKQGCIGDYCSIKSGFAFKSSWWQNTGVRVIKIKNIEPSGLNLQECSFVSEDKVSIAKEFIVKGGDLLIAMTGATIGKFAIVPHVDEILLVNQRVGKFFLGDNPLEKLPFIYCTLKQPEVVSEIINRGQGSAQPNISGNDIMSITCNYPDENIIAGFNNICRPYFEKIIINQYENTRLAAIRDALLPKLMSGEIDVSNVDISALTSTDKLSFRCRSPPKNISYRFSCYFPLNLAICGIFPIFLCFFCIIYWI